MSFLTEYIDSYRPVPIAKTKICRPEDRWAKVEGKWLDPKMGSEDETGWKGKEVKGVFVFTYGVHLNSAFARKEWSEEEIEHFIKETMRSLRGQSVYYNDYCARFPPEFKTRKFEPREKKKRPCQKTGVVEEEVVGPAAPKLAIKDTELMKVARELYERDMEKPTLEPLLTHHRILGYVRPSLFKTGVSEYQESIGRLAYEMIRDGRIPSYVPDNGCRPRWGLPPEGLRQPELDVAPYESERLY